MSIEKGIEDFIKDFASDFKRDPNRAPRNGRSEEDADPRFIPASVLPAGLTAAGIWLPDYMPVTTEPGPLGTVGETLNTLSDFVPLLGAATLGLAAYDVLRFNSHRHRIALSRTVRHVFTNQPKRIYVPTMRKPGALRDATLRFPRGTYVDSKQIDKLSTAINAGFRRSSDTEHIYKIHHHPYNDQIDIQRTVDERIRRSRVHRQLQDALDQGNSLPDAKVSVAAHDEDGNEISYKVTWSARLEAANDVFQRKLADAIIGTVGPHESGRVWAAEWFPNQNTMILKLQEPMPRKVLHPLVSKWAVQPDGTHVWACESDRFHVPYATGEADVVAFWNMSHKSSGPHMLVVGPTGGGKTSLIRTVVTEAIARLIPWMAVDPKRIELQGMVDYPGMECVIPDPMRAARFIRGLCNEMMARYLYMEAEHIDPSDMPVFGIVLDEFYILSGMWRQLAQSPNEEEAKEIKKLNPFGAMGQILALIRSAGGRMLVGIQRPDAKFFGEDSGSVRANFKTRGSLSSLDQDGALMFWGTADAGRTVDASVPGRATVTDAEGNPMAAQVHWTPDVDPRKAHKLSDAEMEMLTGLWPVETPQMQFYSHEFAALIAEEQRIRRETKPGSVPAPITIGGRDVKDFEDAKPAVDIRVGDIVIMANARGELVDCQVIDISTKRNHDSFDPASITGDTPSPADFAAAEALNLTKTTRITGLEIGGNNRVKIHQDFGALETVMIPAAARPGLVGAA